jgi:hypothetical protein
MYIIHVQSSVGLRCSLLPRYKPVVLLSLIWIIDSSTSSAGPMYQWPSHSIQRLLNSTESGKGAIEHYFVMAVRHTPLLSTQAALPLAERLHTVVRVFDMLPSVIFVVMSRLLATFARLQALIHPCSFWCALRQVKIKHSPSIFLNGS